LVVFVEYGEVRDTAMNGIGTGKARGRKLVGQLQLLRGQLRVIKDPDMVLTMPGAGSTVDSYKSIIYTVDQVHQMGKG
jgi:hypothetical protein